MEKIVYQRDHENQHVAREINEISDGNKGCFFYTVVRFVDLDAMKGD